MTHVFIRNPAGKNFPLFARRPEKASLNISRCFNFMILKSLIQKVLTTMYQCVLHVFLKKKGITIK